MCSSPHSEYEEPEAQIGHAPSPTGEVRGWGHTLPYLPHAGGAGGLEVLWEVGQGLPVTLPVSRQKAANRLHRNWWQKSWSWDREVRTIVLGRGSLSLHKLEIQKLAPLFL